MREIKHLTDEQRAAIVEARRRGEKVEALAELYDRSERQIRRVCIAGGIQPGEVRSNGRDWPALVAAAAPDYAAGATLLALAQRLGCSEHGLALAMKAAGHTLRRPGGSRKKP